MINENNKIDIYFRAGQVSLAPHGQEMDCWVKAPRGQGIGKNKPQFFFNNPRSSILPECAINPNDLIFFMMDNNVPKNMRKKLNQNAL